MKQIIFGIILGLLLVIAVVVGVEVYGKYTTQTASDYVAPADFSADIDGIQYRKKS